MTAILQDVDLGGRQRRERLRPAPLGLAVLGGLLLGVALTVVGSGVGVVGVVVLVVAGLAVPAACRRPDLVVAGFALTLAVGPVTVGAFEVVQLTTLLAVVVLLGPAVLRLAVRLPPWPVLAPMVAFVVVGLVSSAVAPVPEVAFNLLVQLVSLVLLTVAVTTGLRTARHLERAVVALVVAGGGLAAYALVTAGPTETYYGGGVVTGRALGLFSQPNELGLVSAALLVLAVGVALAGRSRGVRVVCAVAGVLLVAALGLSLSRGAWLGAAGGLVALAVVCRPVRRPLAVAVTGAAVVVLALAGAGVRAAAEVVSRVVSFGGGVENPYDQRGLIYTTAVRLIGERPWTGHGPGGYTVPAAADALREGAFLQVEHAHDLVLAVGVEYGLVGVAALLALMAGVIGCARAAQRAWGARGSGVVARPHGTPELPAILTAALVAVVVHTVVDYPLRNATCITVVWLLVSLVAAAALVAGERPPPPSPEDRR